MVRVSSKLRHAAAPIAFCAALAGCSSSKDDADTTVLRPGLIQFSPMYSAFDGAHDFQLTPSVPIADPASKDSDPLDPSTLKWQIDGAYVKQDAFDQIPAAVLLTTKKAGTTTVKATGTTKGGIKVRGEATLTISPADPAEWDKGDMRYNGGTTIDFTMLRPMRSTDGSTTCGFPISIGDQLPKTSACSNCHNSMNNISVQHTPTQTAGYSNEQLIQIFTQGEKPAGGTFNSPFLKNIPMPDCIYKSFHTWDIDDETKNGIVWKLRSIPPAKQMDIDFMRLAMMAPPAGAAPAAGAAGAASP
jgi:hypothetical protein